MLNMPPIFKNLSFVAGAAAAIVSSVYLWGMASDRYASESRFTVKSQGESSASAGIDWGLLGGSNATKQDQLIIRDFLMSDDMLEKVVDKFGVRAISGSPIDILWSVDEDTRSLELLKHYRSLLEFTYDDEASISTLVTQGFSAEMSEDLNVFLLGEAEDYINEFSAKTSAAFIEFAESDVQDASELVADITQQLQQAQREGSLANPETDLKVVAETLAEQESLHAAHRAELRRLRQVYQDDTYAVLSQKEKVQEAEARIAELRGRMSSAEGHDLAEASVVFAALQNKLDFANRKYVSTLNMLETAKIQAMQSQKHLVIVEAPNTPDYPEYPKRLQGFLVFVGTVLALSVLLRAVRAVFRQY